MRNLKRTLSLVLAAAMLIGMMVVSASAADFTDKAEIDNTEAVDVMYALGVINGKGDGSTFDPDGTLTRAEAAKIVCYMLMGPTNAEKLGTTGASFTDVPATHWAAPYIGYCASLNILAGVGDGSFNPEGKLTGLAFGKMLLVALGYDAKIEGYVNNKDWATNIAVDMVEAGIDVAGIVLSDDISRDNAAQMAFQTLTATMVKYASKGTAITVDGIDIVTGASSAEPVAITGEGAANYAGAVGAAKGEGTQQFCEKYFKNLKKDNGATDDFGRGASYGWFLDKNANGSFDAASETRVFNAAKSAVVTYTAATLPATIVKDLKGYTFGGTKLIDAATKYAGDGDATWNETLSIGDLDLTEGASAGNGAVIATAVSDLTANGKVVEVYVNSTGAVEDVNVISSTVETIDNITTAANGNVTYDFSVSADKIDYADNTVNADEIVLHGTFAKGDVVTTVQGTSYLHVYPTTKVVGAQSAFNSTYNTITVGGTVYTVGTGVAKTAVPAYVVIGDFSNSATEANYYLDQYGYVVKTDNINTVYTNYAQVKGNNATLSTSIDGSTPAVEARFLLADGTVATYNVKLTYAADTKQYSLLGTMVLDTDDSTGTPAKNSETFLKQQINSLLADNTVFAYSLDGDTISLQAVGTTATANTMVQGAPGAAIATGATSTTVATKTTLLNSDTIYVLYDATKKTATQYVGTLPAGASLAASTTKVIALGNADNTLGTAKVIFGVAGDVSAVSTAEYAYIDASVYTTELKDKVEYRVYEGTKADGSKVAVYGTSDGKDTAGATINTGLVTWNSDSKVTGAYTGSHVKSAATYTVVGEQMVSSSAVYNMANAKVIYIDSTKTSVNGNSCVVVLEVVNGNATNNAAVIYVVGSGS